MRLRENSGARIVSLFIALLLWLHVATDRVSRTTIVVPIDVVGIREGLVTTSGHEEPWTVEIQGTGKALLSRPMGNVRFHLDASSVDPGRHRYPTSTVSFSQSPEVEDVRGLLPSDAGLPIRITGPERSAVKLVRVIEPEFFDLRVEETVPVTLPVHPRIDATHIQGHAVIRSTWVDPARVVITGPTSSVNTLTGLPTRVIEPRRIEDDLFDNWVIEGCRTPTDPTPRGHIVTLDRDTTISIPVHLTGIPELCEVSQPGVFVHMDVTPVIERVIPAVEIGFVRRPPGLDLQVDHQRMQITIAGPKTLVDATRAEDLVLTVDLSPYENGGVYNVAPELHAKDGIDVRNMTPRRVKITLTPRPTPVAAPDAP